MVDSYRECPIGPFGVGKHPPLRRIWKLLVQLSPNNRVSADRTQRKLVFINTCWVLAAFGSSLAIDRKIGMTSEKLNDHDKLGIL